MKKFTLLAFLALLICNVTFSQKKPLTSLEKARKYLDSRGEAIIKFKANSSAQFKELTKIVSISHSHVDQLQLEAEAYVNEEQFQHFLSYGLPFEVHEKDNEIPEGFHNVNMATNASWDTTWDSYPTYSQYEAKMQYWAQQYPNICSLQTIGTLATGRKLLVLKISDNVAKDETEPEFLYTSSMHGDEITGYPMLLRLIDHLLTNYGSLSDITEMINETEIYICPLANPDGTYRTAGNNILNSTSANMARRANANNVDLNRNYPDPDATVGTSAGIPEDGLHPDGLSYQPETIAFMNFEATRNFVLSANYHGGKEVVNFPWDTFPTGGPNIHPHDAYFKRISIAYANLCQSASSNNGYFDFVAATGQPPGATNGSAWYTIGGGRQDGNNYFNHNKEVTIECSDTKTGLPADLPNYWAWNKQSILNYMKQVRYGLHGTVTDESGNPIHAKIYTSSDTMGSWVETTSLGDYHKLQIAGLYSITFEAPGYVSKTMDVTITNDATTILNVTLNAVNAQPTANSTTICEGQTAALNATGSGTIRWFDTITATTPVATNVAYTTPELSASKTYYVERETAIPSLAGTSVTGTTSTPPGGNATTAANGKYITFSSTSAVKLKSIMITTSAAGQINIELQNSSGIMLESKVIRLNGTTNQTVPLDFFIPEATGLRLVMRQIYGANINRGALPTSGLSANGCPVTITGVSAGGFFMLYNWQFEPMKSNRLPVVVNVKPNPVLTTLTPTNKIAGTGPFTLTVNGSNFVNGESVIRWNGINRPTTYVSPTQLNATITANDIASAGNSDVTVISTCNNVITSAQSFAATCSALTAAIPNLPNITAQCSVTSITVPTASNNCGSYTATTANPLTYANQGTYTIVWNYSDGNGNTLSQNQNVIIDDTIAPIPSVPSLPNVTGQCLATVSTAPTATDNCGETITATTDNPLTYSNQGTYTIVWIYNDGRGNNTTQNQTVIVDDTVNPVPNIADLPTVTGLCSVSVTAPTAIDNCTGVITATTVSPTSYTTPGTRTITWVYSDGNGNSVAQNQTITVNTPTVSSSPNTSTCGNEIVILTATGNASSYTWTSTFANSIFTNPAATIAYVAGTNTTTVYVKTPVTAIFTVTATGGTGCISTANTVVTSNSTTWNGTAWSNGTPDSTTAAIISGPYSSVGDLSACSLRITGNASATVNTGHDFKISGAIIIETGANLQFENDANLLQGGTTNLNSGKIISKRNASMRRFDYVYWSSPVTDLTSFNLKAFSPMTVSPPLGGSRFYELIEPTNSFAALDPLTTYFTPAKGFMIRAPNNFPTNGNITPFYGAFEGTPNNGDYSVNVTRTTSARGYNMLGNPYPSPISASLFLASNPGTLYFWAHYTQTEASGANYATYTTVGEAAASGGETPNGIIQTGQGFLLRPSAAGTAIFTNAMRVGDNQGQFFRTTQDDKHRIWINLSNSATSRLNQALIGYVPGATLNEDISIDGKMNYNGSAISSIIGNEKFVIQGRPVPFTENDEVQLNFYAETEGEYKLALDHVDGLFDFQDIFLKDNLIGITHNIKQNPYVFASLAGNYANRFQIIYSDSALGVQPVFNSDKVIVYKQNEVLKINSGNIIMDAIKLFDIRGRLIYEKQNINSSSVSLDDLIAKKQVLLIQITSQNNIITKKAIN